MYGILDYIGLDMDERIRRGLVYTPGEIKKQPEMWRQTESIVHSAGSRIADLLATLDMKETQIILSGAGTSYYVGICLEPFWRKQVSGLSEAWPTTRIVTEPGIVFDSNRPVLHVTFARSGNNPESIGAVELAQQLVKEVYHLGVTTNPDSYLARLSKSVDRAYSLVLPSEACDRGLAMTSSFTSLIVAGLTVARLLSNATQNNVVNSLASLAERIIADSNRLMGIVDEHRTERLYVMGDSSLYGVALEGLLKFEEFSDGQILGVAESFLGARHGSANVIDERTLVVYLLASNPYVRHYQMDVVREISERRPQTPSVAVTLHRDEQLTDLVDYVLVLDESGLHSIPDTWRAPLDTVVLQCMALQCAIKLGKLPDSPFSHRATAKAIDGMRLHPYKTD